MALLQAVKVGLDSDFYARHCLVCEMLKALIRMSSYKSVDVD